MFIVAVYTKEVNGSTRFFEKEFESRERAKEYCKNAEEEIMNLPFVKRKISKDETTLFYEDERGEYQTVIFVYNMYETDNK